MVPKNETIELTTSLIYDIDNGDFRGMNRRDFKKLLELTINDTYFMFNNQYYKQIDGLSMGSPISGTLANIFLCFNEKKWIDNCPADFKPIYYKRYVDDTFIIFKDQNNAQAFLNYINNQHPKIKFTMETERENKLYFLDIISKNDNKLDTSIYRKETFSG